VQRLSRHGGNERIESPLPLQGETRGAFRPGVRTPPLTLPLTQCVAQRM
jgi:hypothetical protein